MKVPEQIIKYLEKHTFLNSAIGCQSYTNFKIKFEKHIIKVLEDNPDELKRLHENNSDIR